MRRVVIAGDRRIAPTTRRAMPLPHEVRKSRVPFFLLIDEFSAFSTDAFAALLSEARNFATLFTLAVQYLAQMSETVTSCVLVMAGGKPLSITEIHK